MFTVARLLDKGTQSGEAPQEKNLAKRIPANVCRYIFNAFLTNQERCLFLSICRTFMQVSQGTPFCQDIYPLFANRLQIVPIANPPAHLTGSLPIDRDQGLPFSCAHYDRSSQRVITGDVSNLSFGSVKIWNRNGGLVRNLSANFGTHDSSAIAVHLDIKNKRAFAAIGGVDRRLTVWDTATTGEVLRSVKSRLEHLTFASIDPQSGAILCGSQGGNLELIGGKCFLFPAGDGDFISHAHDLREVDRVISFHQGDDDRFRGLRIWDRSTQKCLRSISEVSAKPHAMAYDRFGKRIFVCENNDVRAICATTGDVQRTFTSKESEVSFTALNYDPLKKWLITAFSYEVEREQRRNTITVWDSESGKELCSFMPTCGEIHQIDFDPQMNICLTSEEGYVNRAVKLWDMQSKKLIREWPSTRDGKQWEHTRFDWDRQNKLMVLFDSYHGAHKGKSLGGTLRILDYSPAKPKQESKEQPKG